MNMIIIHCMSQSELWLNSFINPRFDISDFFKSRVPKVPDCIRVISLLEKEYPDNIVQSELQHHTIVEFEEFTFGFRTV